MGRRDDFYNAHFHLPSETPHPPRASSLCALANQLPWSYRGMSSPNRGTKRPASDASDAPCVVCLQIMAGVHNAQGASHRFHTCTFRPTCLAMTNSGTPCHSLTPHASLSYCGSHRRLYGEQHPYDVKPPLPPVPHPTDPPPNTRPRGLRANPHRTAPPSVYRAAPAQPPSDTPIQLRLTPALVAELSALKRLQNAALGQRVPAPPATVTDSDPNTDPDTDAFASTFAHDTDGS